MMTADQAARAAGITPETLSRWMKAGLIKAEGRFGRAFIVDAEKIRQVMRAKRKGEKRGRPYLGEHDPMEKEVGETTLS